ncbi:hypothetical protein [Psychrobacter sp. Marseille-P5312]|uniref:hypothetical protein n=1 Tax=Psychrobacter sp. Marseille-P5312 TaxID=2086574 RepID=UPI000CF690E4|nr:hypothetical protein [Psychrobacter sp. Marseille-P5312]
MVAVYLYILPVGLGIMTLAGSLLFLFAFLMSDDNATRVPAFTWFKRLIIVAFILLSIGLFMTFGHFWGA